MATKYYRFKEIRDMFGLSMGQMTGILSSKCIHPAKYTQKKSTSVALYSNNQVKIIGEYWGVIKHRTESKKKENTIQTPLRN